MQDPFQEMTNANECGSLAPFFPDHATCCFKFKDISTMNVARFGYYKYLGTLLKVLNLVIERLRYWKRNANVTYLGVFGLTF